MSAWADTGVHEAAQPGWRSFQAVIPDPTTAALPAGWCGTGDEEPVTLEPRLPADRTFTSMLQSVDQIRFTTFKPGFFFGFTNFVMQVDNASVTRTKQNDAPRT